MSEHPPVTEEMVEAARAIVSLAQEHVPYFLIREILEAAQAVAPPNDVEFQRGYDTGLKTCAEMNAANKRLIDRMAVAKVTCAICQTAFPWHATYRCFQCGNHFCEACMVKHLRDTPNVGGDRLASSPAAPATPPFNPAFDPDVPSSHEVIVRRAVRYVLTRLAYWCDLQRDQMLYRREIEAWRDEHLPPLEPDVPVPAPFRAAPATEEPTTLSGRWSDDRLHNASADEVLELCEQLQVRVFLYRRKAQHDEWRRVRDEVLRRMVASAPAGESVSREATEAQWYPITVEYAEQMFVARAPDFAGLVGCDAHEAQAVAELREAITMALDVMREDGDAIPAASAPAGEELLPKHWKDDHTAMCAWLEFGNVVHNETHGDLHDRIVDRMDRLAAAIWNVAALHSRSPEKPSENYQTLAADFAAHHSIANPESDIYAFADFLAARHPSAPSSPDIKP